MKSKVVVASLLAIMMIVTVMPMIGSDDTEALTGNSNLSLNASSVIVYTDVLETDHSFTFTVSGVPDNTPESSIIWILNDLDDGDDLVSFSASNDEVYTTTGSTATVYGVIEGTVEVEVYIENTTTYYASAVVVVFDSPGTSATEFNFYFRIYIPAGTNVPMSTYLQNFQCPAGKTLSDFTTGFWVNIKQSDLPTGTTFNAINALKWYANQNNWQLSESGGWINTFLGLGTYTEDYDTWTYWAQYHACSGDTDWTFNSVGLGYASTQEYSYIGMIFWPSPSSGDMPPFPGLV